MRRDLLAWFMGAIAMAAITSETSAQGPLLRERPVVVGINGPNAIFWPTLAADREGFVRRAGLATQTVFIGSLAKRTAMLLAGEVDISVTSCESAVDAIDQGQPLVIVAGTMNVFPFSILAANAIKSPRDLAGRTVLLSKPDDFISQLWHRWLAEQGVDTQSVRMQYRDSSTSDRFAALTGGSVDATMLSQPFDFQAEAAGFTRLLDFAIYAGDYAFLCAVVRRDFAEREGDTLRAYLRALVKATAWLANPQSRQRAVDMLTEASGLDRAVVDAGYRYYFERLKSPFPRQLDVSPAGFGSMQAFQRQRRPGAPQGPMERYVDRRFLAP